MGARATYRASDVCDAADIKRVTLNAWRSRPLYGESDKFGPRILSIKAEDGWTEYSEGEALKVCVLARLVEDGLDLRLAARFLDGLNERFESEDGSKSFRALDVMSAEKPLFAVIFNIRVKNLKPGHPAPFEVRWSSSERGARDMARKATKEGNAVSVLIDLGMIAKASLKSLRKESPTNG